MAINIEKMTIEELVEALHQGKVDVNELNVAKKSQREAFLQAVEKRHKLLTKVNRDNINHLVKYAIKENPEWFIYLEREQYTEEITQLYLYKRLDDAESTQKEGEKKAKITTSKSYDGKIVFTYLYTTPEGDELNYYDHELGIPSSIRSSLKLTLKLTDSIKLIEKIDTSVDQLGANKIKMLIRDLLVSNYKAYLNAYIKEKKVGYYTLCTSCSEIESEIKERIGRLFEEYGIELKQLLINRIAMPKDLQNKVEDLAFQIRQKREDVFADVELAKKSLENYEAKLAIEQKYPEAEHSLTEYEKDLALKRYLLKNGRGDGDVVDRTIKIEQKVEAKDKVLEKEKDDIPEVEPKENMFKKLFIMFTVCGVLLSIILMGVTNIGVGLVTLILGAVIATSVGVINREKFKDEEVEPDTEE